MPKPRRCPCCGQEILGPMCEVPGCEFVAEYEGWVRTIDPFTLKPNGHISLRKLCLDHSKVLHIGQGN